MEKPLSESALDLELDTLQLWIKKFQIVHADPKENPKSRAAAKSLQPSIQKWITIVRNRIEHATLTFRIDLSERAIRRACDLLKSAGAPEKLLRAIRTVIDSLWVGVMRKNQRRKALKIKRIEHDAARQNDSVLRYLEILGLENEPYLKLDHQGTHHTAEPDGSKKPHNSKSDSKPEHHGKSSAGAPASPQNLFFCRWMQGTAKSDQNVHSFCVAADRTGLKLPGRRPKLAAFSSWKTAKSEEPRAVKKWYNDANRAMKAHGKPTEDVTHDRQPDNLAL